ncbi:Zinc finger, GRF-type [Sesbania bispinosa]|nr:Zinc finger, GRF-type [Sesbania bispinosa]
MASNSERRRPIGNGGLRSSQQQGRAHNGARCLCKMRVVIQVSGTDANSGRLFYSCLKMRVNERCGFFMWLDNESGAEDTYSMTEATSVMATTNIEDEEGRRSLTEKLCNLEAEMRRLLVCMLFVFSVLFSAIIFLVGCCLKN